MSVRLLHGDCRALMADMDPASVDAIVTDPPYELAFMGKGWDSAGVSFDPETWRAAHRVLKPGGHLLAFGGTRTFHRIAVAIEDAGFEVRDTLSWNYSTGFPKSLDVRKAAIKAGIACECEDSAVPYIHANNDMPHLRQAVSKAGSMGEEVGAELLQPPVLLAVAQDGAGSRGLAEGSGGNGPGRMDGRQRGVLPVQDDRREQPGVEGRRHLLAETRQLQAHQVRPMPGGVSADGAEGRLRNGAPASDGADAGLMSGPDGSGASHRPRPAQQSPGQSATVSQQSRPQTCGRCGKTRFPSGIGTSLKPAWEPVIVARKPLIGTVAQNVAQHGTGGINVDACRIGMSDADEAARSKTRQAWSRSLPAGSVGNAGQHVSLAAAITGDSRIGKAQPPLPAGRWPANVALDECAAMLLDEMSGASRSVGGYRGAGERTAGWGMRADVDRKPVGYGDTGGASRFFYVAKSSRRERNAGLGDDTNGHPTIKPVSLMRWLVRLVTPPGGIVCDPFMGSGTTGIAAALEGFAFVGIEQDAEYLEIARRRIAHAQGPLLAAVGGELP